MKIQKLRLQRGWSQEQLAELSGVSVRTIQRIERGQTPSTETLKALGAVFEVNFATLQEPDMAMSADNPAETAEMLALAHVRRVKEFYIRLAQYGIVMAFLLVVNLMTSPSYLWVVWPALGWGLALAFRGLQVFEAFPFFTGEWERRQVEKHMGRQL